MSAAPYWPFLVYTAAVFLIVGGILVVSSLVGPRHRERVTGEPYESGIPPTGSARLRLSIKFFLIAILFVIFGLELVFIFAWAIAIHELGWPGFWGVVVFIFILAVALIYEWRMGSLDWTRFAAERRLRERREEMARFSKETEEP